jgi:hypothetical protein
MKSKIARVFQKKDEKRNESLANKSQPSNARFLARKDAYSKQAIMEKAKKQGSALVESGFDGLRVKPLHFLSVYTDRIWRSFGRSLHESDA